MKNILDIKINPVVIAIIVLAMFLFVPNIVMAGFGISPPWIENEHMVPGSSFEGIITISQQSVPNPIKVGVSIKGESVKDWIVVEGGNEIIIPKGANQYPVKFKVTIPKDAELGFYEGTIDFTGAPLENKSGGQVSVAIGAQAKILINVGDEVFSDFDIKNVSMSKIEEGWPVEVKVKLDNVGNIPIKPSRVALQIWDNHHNIQIASGDIENMNKVDAFSDGNSSGVFTADLKPGQYWGDIQVYKNGKLALSDRVRFEVLPEYAITGKPILKSISDFMFGSTLGIILTTFILTIILLFAGAIIMKKLKVK